MSNAEQYAQLAAWIREAQYTVVFTGAGASTESGLPDFRSQQGLWKQVPERLASIDTLLNDPDTFYEFYKERFEKFRHVQPNRVHRILARWESQGRVRMIITQNVDGLHRMAGSQEVAELHGNNAQVRCHACGNMFPREIFDRRYCPDCGGMLRPNVVLFGEALPMGEWIKAQQATERADLFVVVGSSLTVYPAARLPEEAAHRGARLVIINQEPTGLDGLADLVCHEKAGDVLEAVDGWLAQA